MREMDPWNAFWHKPPADDSALFYSRECLNLWAQRDRYWPSDVHRSVEQGWNNAHGVALRQEQMLRVGRSADDIKGIRERFAAAGLCVDDVREVRDDRRGVQVAWLLDAGKPEE